MKHSEFVKTIRMPASLARRPVNEQGYVVPWFTPWHDGKWDFRFVAPDKAEEAVAREVCWICGGPLTLPCAFLVGPMCAVNRTSAEPPSHIECAIYAARACPFLSKPKMRRGSDNVPGIEERTAKAPGIMLRRNPGVTLVWVTKSPVYVKPLKLFELGEPERVMFYANSRKATREEIVESIETGLPSLMELAEAQGPEAITELESCVAVAMELVPA